jgi:hypothetical protein
VAEAEALRWPKRLGEIEANTPLGYLVDEILVRDEINALVGDGGAGKSTALLALAGAVASGALAFGERIVEPGPVLLVSGEDSEQVIRNRLDALAAGHRWDVARLHQQLYVLDDAAGVDLDDPRWIARLIEANRDLGCKSQMYDPLVDLCGQGVKENDNSDAKRVTRALRAVMRRTGSTVVLAMHVSKPGEHRSDRAHRVRGASAWKNATRKCWWVEAQGGGMELEDIKRNRTPQSGLMRLKLAVTTDPENRLIWRAAHLALDSGGDVVGGDVLRVMRWIRACATAPSGHEAERGDHGLSRDRARSALGVGRTRGWLASVDGPRRAQLWTVTEAGQARLLLDAGA